MPPPNPESLEAALSEETALRFPPAPNDGEQLSHIATSAAAYLSPESEDAPADPIVRIGTRVIHAQVWSLAWPAVLTMLLQTFNGLMDTLFVGHLPNAAQALAATGVGGQVLFLLISLAMGVSVGTTALVARFTGAQEHKEAVLATGQSLTLSVLLALFFGAVFWLGRHTILNWMLGGDSATASVSSIDYAMQFLSAAMLACVPLFLLNVLMGAFRGLGDTRTPMLIQGFMIATHISFNWLLIYGHLGFPVWGVRGAGTAFALSIYVGVALYLWALVRLSPLREALHPANLRLRLDWSQRILRIGLPASLQAVIRTLGMMSFTGMLAHTAEAAASVAAMNMGIRAEAIAFMPGFGYSVAASALVGQSLGAKDPRRAEQCGWAATAQGILVMAFMASIFFTFAGPLAGLFTSDPLVQKLGAQYLQINAICEPFLALGMILTGALQGAGDTLRPTFITFFTMWIVRMPLAYWMIFRLNLQTRGAWWSMAVTTIVGGLMTAALFRSNRWKKIKV